MITFADFQKLDLQVGTITAAETIEDADKLLCLSVSLGEEERQIVAGIKQHFDTPEDLVDTQVVVVANLEPKEMFGHESQGMILAAGDEELALVSPRKQVSPGTSVS